MPLTEKDIAEMSLETLEAQVKHHNYLYWVDNAPEISDPLFDQLVERLRELAPDSPILDAIGAEGAGDLVDDDTLGWGDKIEHARPMLSLGKAYDEETVAKWFDKFEGGAVASPKVDGIACSIRYAPNGSLELAATRGNGVRGDVITENARRIADIPHSVEASDIEVRGEVYMELSVFKEHFAATFANPRNTTAGGVKQKDPTKTADYRLRFFAYDLLGEDHATESAKFARLAQLGFNPVPITPVSRDAVQTTFDAFVDDRYNLDYETDGVVFRANSVLEQERLGHTAHSPRYAIAYKYQGESGKSVLREVFWSVSRTGAINPVAIVDPVNLSGATVTRASLHNLDFLEKLGAKIGATVMMVRRGGVIPYVEKVVENGDTDIVVPTTCPCGAGPTERRADFLYCTGSSSARGCRAVNLGLLKHYVDAIEVKGFGPKVLEQVYDKGLATEPADLYTLAPAQLIPLDRMGQTLADKLVDNIQSARSLPLATFLRALGIGDLAKFASKELAKHFKTLHAVRTAKRETIAAIHGLGDITADAIVTGLEEKKDVVERLLQYVTVQEDTTAAEEAADADAPAGPLSDTSFLFTGTLESMKRKDAQTRVRDAGGTTPDSVVSELDYLVIGDADLAKFQGGWRSSKLKKAEKLIEKGSKLKIIGETQFLGMLPDTDALSS